MKMKSESEVVLSCPTLSDPMDCSLPGSSVHGIFQARVLEWGAIAFSELVNNHALSIGVKVVCTMLTENKQKKKLILKTGQTMPTTGEIFIKTDDV